MMNAVCYSESLPHSKKDFPPWSPDAFKTLLVSLHETIVMIRHGSRLKYLFWDRELEDNINGEPCDMPRKYVVSG